MKFARFYKRLRDCRSGGGVVEYMLVLGVIAVQLVVAFYALAPFLRDGVSGLLDRILDMKP